MSFVYHRLTLKMLPNNKFMYMLAIILFFKNCFLVSVTSFVDEQMASV